MKEKISVKKFGLAIAAVVMLAFSLVLALGSLKLYSAAAEKYDRPAEVAFTISETSPIDISAMGAEKYSVRAAMEAHDSAGELVAYVVESSATGYNTGHDIVISSVISAEGEVLASIEVLDQQETEYFGNRIATPMFTDRFTGRYLPVVLTGSMERGAHVDALSKSTISSEAVIKAVNNAHSFVNEAILLG